MIVCDKCKKNSDEAVASGNKVYNVKILWKENKDIDYKEEHYKCLDLCMFCLNTIEDILL